MDSMTLQVVEKPCKELAQEQLLDLSEEELADVGGGCIDPGIIVIEK